MLVPSDVPTTRFPDPEFKIPILYVPFTKVFVIVNVDKLFDPPVTTTDAFLNDTAVPDEAPEKLRVDPANVAVF